MSIEVIDNFLEEQDFRQVREIFLGTELPWYYYDFKVSEQESSRNVLCESQMVHLFYNHFTPSQYYPVVAPIVRGLNAVSLIKVKANMTPAWSSIERFDSHVDNSFNAAKTAVFYVNSNDGYTEFVETGDRVESVENRIVIFPSNTSHLGTTHTNAKTRVVVNINFFDGK
jgi:hypothetical protein